jgi:hypothetical protein
MPTRALQRFLNQEIEVRRQYFSHEPLLYHPSDKEMILVRRTTSKDFSNITDNAMILFYALNECFKRV